MRSVLPLVFAAILSIAAGWCGARWLAAQPHPASSEAAAHTHNESVGVSAPSKIVAPSDPASSTERIKAFVALCEQPPSAKHDHELIAALLQWSAADFAASAEEMVALFTRLPPASEERASEFAGAWMDRWLEIDAAGALRVLSSSPVLSQLPASTATFLSYSRRASCAQGGALMALARRAPDWLKEYLAASKPGSQREVGIYVLLDQAARRGDLKVADMAAGFSTGADRKPAMTGYLNGLSDANPQAGFDAAWAEAPGPFREELLSLAFRGAGKRGVSTVRELLERVEDPALHQRAAVAALDALAFQSREDALPLIKEESERMAAAGTWKAEPLRWASYVEAAARGPQAASFAEWAVSFEADRERQMFARIVDTWAGRDPAALRAWLGERAITLDPTALGKLGNALATLARNDTPAARDWAERLPAGTLRDQARFQVALASAAGGDLAQAAAAYQTVAGNDANGELAKQLARALTKQDGAAAAEWAMQRPAGAARTAALRTVAEHWSLADPRAAAGWLEQMPAGSERDAAVQLYAMRVAAADAEAAAQWVGQISDSVLRNATVGEVFRSWLLDDPSAARAWMREVQGISEEVRTKYLRNTQ